MGRHNARIDSIIPSRASDVGFVFDASYLRRAIFILLCATICSSSNSMILQRPSLIHFLLILLPLAIDSARIPLNPEISPRTLNASSSHLFLPLRAPEANQCTADDRWTSPLGSPHDCLGALGHFFYEEMSMGGSEPMEFLGPHKKATSYLRTETLPIKFVFSTCPTASTGSEHVPTDFSVLQRVEPDLV